MAVAIESISPSSGDATDRFLVRRGAGPADHTIQLLTPASVKALLSISTADVSGLAAVATSGEAADIVGLAEAIDDRVALLLVEGSGINLVYDDVLGTLTVSATGGGGSVLSGDATLTLSTNKYEHEETVAAVGVTGSNRVNVWLAPTTDSDENDADTLTVTGMQAAPGTDQITVRVGFRDPTHGPIKIQWSAF